MRNWKNSKWKRENARRSTKIDKRSQQSNWNTWALLTWLTLKFRLEQNSNWLPTQLASSKSQIWLLILA